MRFQLAEQRQLVRFAQGARDLAADNNERLEHRITELGEESARHLLEITRLTDANRALEAQLAETRAALEMSEVEATVWQAANNRLHDELANAEQRVGNALQAAATLQAQVTAAQLQATTAQHQATDAYAEMANREAQNV